MHIWLCLTFSCFLYQLKSTHVRSRVQSWIFDKRKIVKSAKSCWFSKFFRLSSLSHYWDSLKGVLRGILRPKDKFSRAISNMEFIIESNTVLSLTKFNFVSKFSFCFHKRTCVYTRYILKVPNLNISHFIWMRHIRFNT